MIESQAEQIRSEMVALIGMVEILLSGNPEPLVQQRMVAVCLDLMSGFRGRLLTGNDIELEPETQEFLAEVAQAMGGRVPSDSRIILPH